MIVSVKTALIKEGSGISENLIPAAIMEVVNKFTCTEHPEMIAEGGLATYNVDVTQEQLNAMEAHPDIEVIT